jgi:hypothetical protein
MKKRILPTALQFCRLLPIFIGLLNNNVFCQNLTQTIRGTILDVDTHAPLPGTTVVITGTDPVIGSVTDSIGDFRITKVPVGRYDLKFSFIGYEPYVTSFNRKSTHRLND